MPTTSEAVVMAVVVPVFRPWNQLPAPVEITMTAAIMAPKSMIPYPITSATVLSRKVMYPPQPETLGPGGAICMNCI